MPLITRGELGLLLCQRHQPPLHIPTVAQKVFDVSGTRDTVIASYTLAICTRASPVEAAILANHAAGVVVGQRGTLILICFLDATRKGRFRFAVAFIFRHFEALALMGQGALGFHGPLWVVGWP